MAKQTLLRCKKHASGMFTIAGGTDKEFLLQFRGGAATASEEQMKLIREANEFKRAIITEATTEKAPPPETAKEKAAREKAQAEADAIIADAKANAGKTT